MSSSADDPGRAVPGAAGGQEGTQAGAQASDQATSQEGAQAAPAGDSGDAAGSRTRRRRLVAAGVIAAIAVAAAVAAGVIVAVAGSSTPPPAVAAAGGGTVAHAVAAHEAAAVVSVLDTGGTITGGPLLGTDGRLWLVELSHAAHQPVLTALDPVTYAVSTYKLPISLGGLSVQYTGAEAYGSSGQVWLGAKAAPPGQQPTGILVRFTTGSGAVTPFPVLGGCSGDPAAQPAQLFTASDGGVWVECSASQDSTATSVFRLSASGAVTQPYIANYLNRELQGTRLWNEIAGLPQAKIGPLAATVGGTMWGLTTGGMVQFTAAGSEIFTPLLPENAVELQTQGPATIGPLQLAGNGLLGSVGGIGDCRSAGTPPGQDRECALIVDGLGNAAMIAAVPGDDGHAGPAAHPAGMDRSGDVWFIVDGTAGGRAPAGQYFFEVTSGGGTRIVPFSVPGSALPVPAGQQPVISLNGAVWTTDPAAGPGALVEVMPSS